MRVATAVLALAAGGSALSAGTAQGAPDTSTSGDGGTQGSTSNDCRNDPDHQYYFWSPFLGGTATRTAQTCQASAVGTNGSSY